MKQTTFLGTAFAPTTQYVTYYNGLKLDTAVIGELWTGTKWADNFRDSSAYDSNNEKILAERLGYNSKAKEFTYTESRIEYQYSTAGQLTFEKNYAGDGNITFIPLGTTTYQYDANENNNYVLSQVYDSATQSFENYEQDIFYYSTILSGIPSFAIDQMPAVVLHPNPCSGMLNAQLNLLKPEVVKLQIMNLQGSVLMNKTCQLGPGISSVQLNASDLPAGIYFLQIIDAASHQQSSVPFIKQ